MENLYEGCVEFPRNTLITMPGPQGKYKLKQDIRLSYTDWSGAGATLIFDNPLGPSVTDGGEVTEQSIRFGPVLAWEDIRTSAREVLGYLARRHHEISAISEANRTPSEKSDFTRLDFILKAA